MTPQQKLFKSIQAEAKKLKAKNKKLKHIEAVKQAWAIYYSKKRKGIAAAPAKKAAKKAAKKKAAAKSYHKDTQSHNVKISVMSGVTGIKSHFKKKYGELATAKLMATTKTGKRKLQKEMSEVAKKIKKLNSF